jgi:hypothetical protein
MSKRFQRARALVKHARGQWSVLAQAYRDEAHEPEVSDEILIIVKHILLDLRSALDFCAKEIYEQIGSPRAKDKTYFPISRKGARQADFNSCLGNNIYGLATARPDLAAVLESYQEFDDARNAWLPFLATVSNLNKHDDLSEQTRHETQRISVVYNFGGMPMTVSEVDDHGRQRLSSRPAPEMQVPPLKPLVIGGGTVSIGGVPIDPHVPHPAFEPLVTTEVWVEHEFSLADFNEPVLPFLTTCIDGVSRIVNELESKL